MAFVIRRPPAEFERWASLKPSIPEETNQQAKGRAGHGNRIIRERLWVLWLVMPLTALNYSLCWKRLPAQIAMHYDASGRPNRWASPDGARIFSLGFLFFILLVFTSVGYLVANTRPDRDRPAVIFLFIAMCLVFLFMNGFVWFNLVG